ncbi:MAG TPA: 16S rRNA (uracil(1498)-N(3))-methyltransferase [Acetivibrio sp.]|nr:16S rRNA (uracil(1498)-N(3))-methyltransferase [Acetivibrio sp.]
MSRFFVNSTNISGDSIIISGEDVNHIKRVLRLGSGDNITVSDGKGVDYRVEIVNLHESAIETRIIETVKNITEPPVEIILYQGLPKSDKMDYIIQKGVELGLKGIVPVITERTVVKLTDKKDEQKKCERWNRISMEAAKQSNRGIIPPVELPIDFKKAVNAAKDFDISLIPYEKERGNGLKDVILNRTDAKKVSIFIGPEGGFTEKEIETAVENGVYPVTLGPRILRTETAGIAVLSILMYELGDVGK